MRRVAYTDPNGNSHCYGYARGKCDADSYRYGNCDDNSNTDAYSYYTSKEHSDAETSADSQPAPVAGTLTCPP